MPKDTCPSACEFEQDFTYLAACNHFNNEPKTDDKDTKLPPADGDCLWMENGVYVDREKDLPQDLYSTRNFTDKLIGILETRDEKAKTESFFGYLAYTAPHACKLQARAIGAKRGFSRAANLWPVRE